jgi:hypothetical protein
MAFSFGPTGVVGANGYHPYDNGVTDTGNYVVSTNNSDSGWVFLGNHQGPAPYNKAHHQILKPDNIQGSLEYEIWNNGDANHEAGGLYVLRVNQWYSNQGFFTSAYLRCLGGKLNDITARCYRSTDGIWIFPGFIWGSFFIRRRGKDDRAWPTSTYCSVANGGSLDTEYGASNLPTGNSPYDLQPNGGYDIEDTATRPG